IVVTPGASGLFFPCVKSSARPKWRAGAFWTFFPSMDRKDIVGPRPMPAIFCWSGLPIGISGVFPGQKTAAGSAAPQSIQQAATTTDINRKLLKIDVLMNAVLILCVLPIAVTVLVILPLLFWSSLTPCP